MKIEMEHETKIIVSNLKMADGYLDCEKVIIRNIKQHLSNGFSIPLIESYLNKLAGYFESLFSIKKYTTENTNYGYVTAFLKTLLATPYWKSWIMLPGL